PYGLLNRISMERPESEDGRMMRPSCRSRMFVAPIRSAAGILALMEDFVAARLHEFQGHAVRFADRGILFAILVAELVRRRQRPYALLVVLGVLRVRVDFALGLELEARVGRELDHVVGRQITLFLGLLDIRTVGRSVIFDTKHAARLQNVIE